MTDWVSVSPQSGTEGTTQVTATATSTHTGRVQRSVGGTAAITGTSASDTNTIIQNPKAEFILFSPDEYTIASAGTSFTITGKSNSSLLRFRLTDVWDSSTFGMLTITPEDGQGSPFAVQLQVTTIGGQSYMTSGQISGDPGASQQYSFSIVINVPENETISTITNTLTGVCYNGTSTDTATLTQNASGASIEISVNSVVLAAEAGSTATFNIISNGSWTYDVN